MQSKPDDLTLLRTYKRAGVEPIKLAKYVFYNRHPNYLIRL